MSRNTQVTPEELNYSFSLQYRLDKFWNLIEDKYEDEWRVEYSGAMTLQVTEDLLERILRDNPEVAKDEFGVSRKEELLGLYSITGVYSNYYTLVDGPREYFFEQGY